MTRKTDYGRIVSVLCMVAATCAWGAGDALALRVVTYNILNYNGDSAREVHYRTILSALEPDILVVQEILSQSAVDRFRDDVLNHVEGPAGIYEAATFVNGPDTDNAMFYRTDVATFSPGDHVVIPTTLRDIDRWKVRLVGYGSAGAELYAYTCHLKASQGSTNENRRLAEATQMRQNGDALPAGTNFLYAGDYNIYYSDEPAYQLLITPGTDPDGQGFDPIDTPGFWHNNAGFALIHSQSPRTAQFGGGANGGMDDRFDIILQSASLDDDQQMAYVPGTYFVFGQDGLHFNMAIVDPPVIPEGSAVADALHLASDHLPVSMDLQVPAKVSAPVSVDFGPVIVGAVSSEDLAVSNGADLVTFMFADGLDYTLAATPGFLVDAGPFQAAAGAGPNLHPVVMLTNERGTKNGSVSVASDDVDDPVVAVSLTGTVLSHARPSVSADAELTGQTLDFGIHEPGQFPVLTAEVHNFSYDSLQARLEVYDATITGPDAVRFSIQGGFNPATVADTPAGFLIQVGPNLDGVSEGQVLTAGLVFSTRDEQGLPGAAALSDVSFQLLAEIAGSPGVPGDLNGDGQVDLTDFITFASCFAGASVTVPPAGCDPVDFAAADLDGDLDVDLVDFTTFATNFTG